MPPRCKAKSKFGEFCLLTGPVYSDMKSLLFYFPIKELCLAMLVVDSAIERMLFSEQSDTDCHQVQLPAQCRTNSDTKWEAGCKRKTGIRKGN